MQDLLKLNDSPNTSFDAQVKWIESLNQGRWAAQEGSTDIMSLFGNPYGIDFDYITEEEADILYTWLEE